MINTINKSLAGILLLSLLLITLGLSAKLLTDNAIPEGWHISGSAPENYIFGIDTAHKVDGAKSAIVVSKPNIDDSNSGFGTLMQTINAKGYLGQRVKLTVYLKSELSSGSASAWFRVDGMINGEQKTFSMDNMRNRRLQDTSDWTEYNLVLDVTESAVDLNYGVMLLGTGKVWFDKLSINIVDDNTPLTTTYAPTIIVNEARNLSFEND